MNINKNGKIKEFLNELTDDEFLVMIQNANRNIDTKKTPSLELSSIYNPKNRLSISDDLFPTTYRLDRHINIA